MQFVLMVIVIKRFYMDVCACLSVSWSSLYVLDFLCGVCVPMHELHCISSVQIFGELFYASHVTHKIHSTFPCIVNTHIWAVCYSPSLAADTHEHMDTHFNASHAIPKCIRSFESYRLFRKQCIAITLFKIRIIVVYSFASWKIAAHCERLSV